jgi:hypothetical protein
MIRTQSAADADAETARDIPVIMSRPMVRATFDGRKSMTRRDAWLEEKAGGWRKPSIWQRVRPGDRLYVRENWRPDDFAPDDPARTIFMADASDEVLRETRGVIRWRPSIHLPRARSRLTLVVSAVKIEPLLDISEEDARAEGFEDGILDDGFGPQDIGGRCTIESPGTFASAAGMFQVTWAQLHPDWDGYSSPDVVAVSFRVIKANIDSPEVDPENAKLARARREAAFMGQEEGARHIVKSLGKIVTTFEPGSLFEALNAPMTAIEKSPDPEPAESVDPGQIATGGPEEERPLMEAKQPGELEAGETITASARAVPSPALRAPVDPAAVEGASGETRGHAPPAVYSPDPEELERRRALAAVAAGENISPEVTRDLVGIGFLHVTTSRLVVTEEGDAWLRSTAAELSSCV